MAPKLKKKTKTAACTHTLKSNISKTILQKFLVFYFPDRARTDLFGHINSYVP